LFAEATALYKDFGPGLPYGQNLILLFLESMWFHPNCACLIPFLGAGQGQQCGSRENALIEIRSKRNVSKHELAQQTPISQPPHRLPGNFIAVSRERLSPTGALLTVFLPPTIRTATQKNAELGLAALWAPMQRPRTPWTRTGTCANSHHHSLTLYRPSLERACLNLCCVLLARAVRARGRSCVVRT
jgi:hypothetical protein